MNSRNIELVIHYCSSHFETCAIFQEQIKSCSTGG
jgi:hypothetical protein